jgi:hypothetical protein
MSGQKVTTQGTFMNKVFRTLNLWGINLFLFQAYFTVFIGSGSIIWFL